MVFANFASWTEEDPNYKLTRTIPKATWTNMRRDEVCYLYKAMTTEAEFTHELEFQVTSIDVNADGSSNFLTYIWAVCEAIGRLDYLEVGKSIKLVTTEKGNSTTLFQLYLHHKDDIVQDRSTDLEVGTTYYLKITKVGPVVTCTIYSDGARTTIVDTLTMDLTGEDEENMSFAYIMTTASSTTGGDDADQSDGWVQMWLYSSGGGGGYTGTMINAGGSLDFEIFSLKEKGTCDVAVRPVPLRSAGPKVDVGHYQPHCRLLQITVIVADADKTTLQNIISSGTKIGISLTSNWYYYGWLKQKDVMWEYRKLDGTEKVWLCKLKLDIEFIRWYA